MKKVKVIGSDGAEIRCEAQFDGHDTTCLFVPLVSALDIEFSVVEERRRHADLDTSEPRCTVVRCLAVKGRPVEDLGEGEEVGPPTRCSVLKVLEAADREWSGSLDGEVRIRPIVRLVGDAPLRVTIPRVDREMIATKLLAVHDHASAEDVSRRFDRMNSRLIEERIRRSIGEAIAVTVTAGDSFAISGGPDATGDDADIVRVIALEAAFIGTVEHEAFHFDEIMTEIGHDVRTKREKARDRQRIYRQKKRLAEEERASAVYQEQLRLQRDFEPIIAYPCEEEDGSCTRDCPLWPPGDHRSPK